MSVVNISFLSKTEILILSDTMMYDGREPAGLMKTKVHSNHASTFAFGMRGHVPTIMQFVDNMSGWPDLDHADEALSLALPSVPAGRFPLGHEVFLAGWSDRAGGLAVVEFCVRPDGAYYRATTKPGATLLNPRVKNSMAVPAVDQARLIKLALAQVKLLDHAPFCIGGVMHLTRVTPDSASQWVCGLYPGYHEAAARFGDPNADEVAAFLSSERVAA